MNIKTKRIKTPLNDKIVESLHMGDRYYYPVLFIQLEMQRTKGC